ncbi:MAG: right-handed parallel beta-helix repeat-containing protein [Phycisphaerae bacterium]
MTLPSLAVGAGREVRLYVSPSGDDSWSGKLEAPNSQRSDGPFATIQRARGAVRALKADGGLTGPVRVLLREGVYELDEPLTFTPEDSGTDACPITYAAYPNEKPILSGGRRITGWRAGQINDKPCLVADLPEVSAGKWHFTQLFVGQQRRPRSRLPESGFFRFAKLPPPNDQPDYKNGPNSAEFTPGDLAAWRNLDDLELVVLQGWRDRHLRIAGIDEKEHVVKFVTPGGVLQDEKGQPARYYVTNVAEAVTQAGQWYLDRPAGRLYYLPQDGETADNLQAVAPRLERLVVFKGEESKPVQHIRLERLALRHAEFHYPTNKIGAGQAAHDVPGAVLFDKSNSCALYACEISAVGGYGVEMNGQADRLIACDIGDLGAGGVKIGGNNNEVADCFIHDGGMIHHQGVGILVFNCNGTRIRHNEVCRFDYTGISCGWSWGYAQTSAGDNRIEYNHIHDIGRGILSDMGGIYTLGVQPGTVLRGNVIHDVSRYGYGGWGIYHDEGSSEMLDEDNLVYRTEDGSWYQHYGQGNVARNNIFALAKDPRISCLRREGHLSFLITGNIFYWTQSQFIEGLHSRMQFKGNLYWRVDPPLEHEPNEGPPWDRAGKVADPLFVDPAHADFTLQPGSPALAIGFKPFPLDQAGPRFRKPSALPATLDAWPADTDAPMKHVRTRMEITDPSARDGTGGKVRVTLDNTGKVDIAGLVRVHTAAGPCTGPDGKDTLAFDLPPGKSTSRVFGFTADPQAAETAIEIESDCPCVSPAYLYYVLPEWPVGRIKKIASLDEIPAALAEAQRKAVQTCGVPVGEIRLALAGEDLAVQATILDHDANALTSNWGDRGLDLLVSKPDSNVVRRIKLHPTGWKSGEAVLFDGKKEMPTPQGVRFQIRPLAEGGYEMLGLVPLSLFDLDPAAERFKFDACFRLSLEKGNKPEFAPLFSLKMNAEGQFTDNSGFPLVVVGQ